MKRILPFCAVTLAITSLAVSFGLSSKSVVIGQTYRKRSSSKVLKPIWCAQDQSSLRYSALHLTFPGDEVPGYFYSPYAAAFVRLEFWEKTHIYQR